jgi:hypothetical protein
MDAVTDGTPSNAKIFNFAAIVLIFLAFALPFGAAFFGLKSAPHPAETIGVTAGRFTFLALVSWLLTRKKVAATKANGHFIIGILLLLLTCADVAKAGPNDDKMNTFTTEALTYVANRDARFEKFVSQFDKYDLSALVDPKNLTSRGSISKGKEVLSKYKALLEDRKALLRSQFVETEGYIRSHAPSMEIAEKVIASMNPMMRETLKAYQDDDLAQGAAITAISDILNWAETQIGKLSVRNSTLVFSSPSQQKEFQKLYDKLKDSAVQSETVQNSVNSRLSAVNAQAQSGKAKVETQIRK